MSIQTSAYFFKQEAHTRMERSSKVCKFEIENLVTSYDYVETHAAAIAYPVMHMAHVVVDSLNLARGLVLLAASILRLDLYSFGAVFEGLGAQLAAVIFDTINCALSALSFLTRTFLCSMPTGYLSSHERREQYGYGYTPHWGVSDAQQVVHDENIFGEPEEIVLSRTTMSDDQAIYNNTFSF